jgi:tetratricopeptide (TPR) repeat protein
MDALKAQYLMQNRDFAGVKKLLTGILMRNGPSPNVLYQLSIAEAERGDFEEALEHLSRVIAIDPRYAAAHYTKANLLSLLNRHHDAMPHHDQAVIYLSSNPWALINRGISRAALRDYAGAIDDFDRAIELNPSLSVGYSNKGSALIESKLFQQALEFLDKAITLDALNVDAVIRKSFCLSRLNRPAEALICAEQSIKLQPNLPQAWCSRAVALNYLKHYEGALASYNKSIELKPDYAEAWSNRGNTLSNLGLYDEALASFEKSIELKPDYAEAWFNRGVVLGNLRRHEAALANYERASELDFDYADAIYNKSVMQLTCKIFSAGFKNYLHRWKTESFSRKYIETILPPCGPNFYSQKVLLWAEQGLGDEIFYAGMLREAINKFSEIGLIADKRLHSLFKRSFPRVKLFDREVTRAPTIDIAFDCHAPIGNLGYILDLSVDKISAFRAPFLVANSVKSDTYKMSAPFTRRKIVCGISWQSSNKESGKQKSLELLQLEPILKDSRFEFINLQYGEVDWQIESIKQQLGVNINCIKNLDIRNHIDDFTALIDACDIVITTSNVTAHLAGAIGKKGCVLVPFSKGRIWYWHCDDIFSYWYPSLKVFYQQNPDNYSIVIQQAYRWLQEVFNEND